MQQQIEVHHTGLKEANSASSRPDGSTGGNEVDNNSSIEHIQLGSRSNLLTLGLLEDLNRGNPAFQRFEASVRAFIASIDPLFQSTPYCLIKVFILIISRLSY